ncbi:hypothetical protein PIB30_018896 [Stylosanthes scabra]|uniref:Uncharacterized protein n=1 Tax=Stylosanthes scabra TaxID=79078 RepID=A0ABU6W873_9FABA|nr:hypothetical protein [Stylosanthes scabra]
MMMMEWRILKDLGCSCFAHHATYYYGDALYSDDVFKIIITVAIPIEKSINFSLLIAAASIEKVAAASIKDIYPNTTIILQQFHNDNSNDIEHFRIKTMLYQLLAETLPRCWQWTTKS